MEMQDIQEMVDLQQMLQLMNPYGVAVDSNGNIYIADTSNNRIRKVNSTTGIITTVAGNGMQDIQEMVDLQQMLQLYYPYGVAVDSIGNIYIADTDNNRIRKVNSTTGIITTVAGNGIAWIFRRWWTCNKC